MSTTADSWPGRSWYQQLDPDPAESRPLRGQQRCDIVVIGGGLAGISTALALLERESADVRVIESGYPGTGASGRNGGFVFAGYSLGNEALIDQLGAPRARLLHGWTRAAVERIRSRIDELRIDCQVNDAGVVLADWFGDDRSLSAFQQRMHDDLGFELDFLDAAELQGRVVSPRYGAGLHEPGSFHFNPLAYLRGLAGRIEQLGGRVHDGSPVRHLTRSREGWQIDTPEGQLRAATVVLATGGYDRRLWPRLQRALQPVATYVGVTEPLGPKLGEILPKPVAVYDTRFAFDYYRPLPDSRLLWGGRIAMACRSPAAIRRLLGRDLARVFPGLAGVRFDAAWGGWMSYARHQMPLLGQTRDGLWYALAFGGHGMATTTLAGDLVAEAVLGENDWKDNRNNNRLAEFARWPAVWAGGPAGRAVMQSFYYWLQAADGVRDLLSTIRRR